MKYKLFLFAGATLLTVQIASASAITDLIQLPGSAYSNYAVVVQGGTGAFNLTSDSPINGNVAIGTTSKTVQTSNDTINGNLDFGGSINLSGGVHVSGTTNANVALADAAVADAEKLFQVYTASTGFSGLPSTSGTLNVSTNPGSAFGGNTHEHVYDVTVTNGYGGDLTINASNSEYVIINIGKGESANYALNGGIALSGGITSDHVLINIATTGNFTASGASHGKTVNADIIDNAGLTNLDNFNLNGRLFCTDATKNCSFVSNAVLTQPLTVSATPEPASISMLLGGLFLVAAGKWRRNQLRG